MPDLGAISVLMGFENLTITSPNFPTETMLALKLELKLLKIIFSSGGGGKNWM